MKTRRLILTLLLGLGLVLATLGTLALSGVLAAGFTVTTTADDGSPDSLRGVILQTNANGTDDTITLPAGTYTLTIPGAGEESNATGDLDVISSGALTIAGAGAGQTTINANGIDRVLHIHTGAVVVISGVTIYNGSAGSGGGIRVEDGDLTLIDTRIYSNSAFSDHGGGVFVNEGSATLVGTQVVSNSAVNFGGGVYVDEGSATLTGTQVVSNSASAGGGVLVWTGSATLTGTQVVSNSAPHGGGVFVYQGSATLTGTQVVSNSASSSGGGVYVDEGSATLCVSGGLIESNSADRGGGVYVDQGSATLTGTQVVSNSASSNGGGVYVSSGSATLRVSGGLIESNSASSGGGVYVSSGSATLNETQVISNSAFSDHGGGVYVYQGDAALAGTQVVSNSASSSGGGVYVYRGTLTMLNTTVSGNQADRGGGLYRSAASGATSAITYSTIVSNTAFSFGGGIYPGMGEVRLQNSIVAHNGPTNCAGNPLTSNGHNLEDANSCGLTATGDITAINPLIGPLTYDGGTWVHPLLADSPAIEGGLCLPGVTTVDQRGVARPEGAQCDSGAYEWVWRKVYLPLVLRGF